MADTRNNRVEPTVAESTATDANRDPITGEPGAHPIGTGIGAVAGGVAAGAAGGAAAGPVGAVVGAVAGGVAGGLAGKGIAESIDPTAEDQYWSENYTSRPYYNPSTCYDEYRPAYRYGWEARARHADRTFDEAEPDLERDWEGARGQSTLAWDRAKHAARDAWDRVAHLMTPRHPGTV
jgi:phage tail tape-measure protein